MTESQSKIYGIVYCVKNVVNGKKYIGQTIQSLTARKKDHKASICKHPHLLISKAYKKYGFENFEWTVLYEASSRSDLDRAEKKLIQEHNTFSPAGYNMTTGGEGAGHLPVTVEKIRTILQNRRVTKKTRQLLSRSLKGKYTGNQASFFGKKHTEETKRKMSEAQKGDKNHNYGKKATRETRHKMSESHKGENHWNNHPVICIETGEIFLSASDAMQKTNIDNSSIIKCCKKIRKTAGGYTWKYKQENEE